MLTVIEQTSGKDAKIKVMLQLISESEEKKEWDNLNNFYSIALANSIENKDELLTAIFLGKLSIIFTGEESADYFKKCIEVFRNLESEGRILSGFVAIINFCRKFGNLEQAKRYFEIAEAYGKEKGEQWLKLLSVRCLIYKEENDFVSYFEYLKRLFQDTLEQGNKEFIQAVHGEIYDFLDKTEDYEFAEDFYSGWLELFQKVGYRVGQASSCVRLAEIKEKSGDLVTARLNYEQSLEIFKELNSTPATL